MTARRWLARRKRPRVQSVWPILPGSEQPPAGWPGWPDGHAFALVLTHDVEGPAGLAKVRALAELEMELGFRSCFNFVPEGRYRVPDELRQWLVANGFEVGVHDLHHDGRLFGSRREFLDRAPRVNQYLQAWGAAGFRSAFMLHNLTWLHALDIRYDASTFDTDPFEPQPDGRGTIFPFWVPAPVPTGGDTGHSRSGYVELPYTLPQDSTLFLILRERTPAIWLTKLDWIAANRGMALVNVHPDYLCFDGEKPSARTFPVAHYRALLEHVRRAHAGAYWQVTPSRVADWVGAQPPMPGRRRPLRVCMVSYSHYESDNRVMRYAESLAERGDQVDVLALRSAPETPREENLNGVVVHRLQARFGKSERSKLGYAIPMVRFLGVAGAWLTRAHLRSRFDVIHVHNVPDFLVFCATVPKLTGAAVILDIHDLLPEFAHSKFARGTERPLSRALLAMERWSGRFANAVIVSNDLWAARYAARIGVQDRCRVFINNVDVRLFRPRPHGPREAGPILLFPGGLQWHQGLDLAIHAVQLLRPRWPQLQLHIYGDGSAKPDLQSLSRRLQLDDCVRFFPPVRLHEMPAVMANADIGIVPKRADSFGNEAYSTKIMEFMAVGVPVVASATRIDRFYFDDTVVRFFESGNPGALAAAVDSLLQSPRERERLVRAAREYAERNCWDCRKREYLALVDGLLVPAPPASRPEPSVPGRSLASVA